MTWDRYLAFPLDALPAHGEATAGEVFEAADDLATYVDNTFASTAAMEEAVERRIKALEAKTGTRLVSPYLRPKAAPRGTTRAAGAKSEAEHFRDFEREVIELESKFPDMRRDDRASPSIREDAKKVAREASERFDRVTASRRGGFGTFATSVVGGARGSLRDPLQVATIFAGGGAGGAKTAGGRILSTFLREAVVNASVEGAIQPFAQKWRKEAGLEHGWQPAMRNVLLAGAVGGTLGASVRGAGELAGRAFRPESRITQPKISAPVIPAPDPVQASPVVAPKPDTPAPGMVRMWHGGGEYNGGPRWFSSNKTYAQNYRDNAILHYVDIPRSDPIFDADIPDQSVDQGFTVNVELPEEIARNMQRVDPVQTVVQRALDGDLDAVVETLAPVRNDLPPPVRGAIDALEAERLTEAQRPAAIAPDIHEAQVARAMDAAENPEKIAEFRAYKGMHAYREDGEVIDPSLGPRQHSWSSNDIHAGFFASNPEVASHFADALSRNAKAVFPVRLKFNNPIVVDGGGKHAADFQFGPAKEGFEAYFTDPKYAAHDGVILKNVLDASGDTLRAERTPTDIYIPKNPKQISSAFPSNVSRETPVVTAAPHAAGEIPLARSPEPFDTPEIDEQTEALARELELDEDLSIPEGAVLDDMGNMAARTTTLKPGLEEAKRIQSIGRIVANCKGDI